MQYAMTQRARIAMRLCSVTGAIWPYIKVGIITSLSIRLDVISYQIAMVFPTSQKANGFAENAPSPQRTPWCVLRLRKRNNVFELVSIVVRALSERRRRI